MNGLERLRPRTLIERFLMGRVPAAASIRAFAVIAISFLLVREAMAEDGASWRVHLSDSLAADEAIRVVLDDLRDLKHKHGILFEVAGDERRSAGNAILVGAPSRNALTAGLIRSGTLQLEGVSDPQGYEIRTLNDGPSKTIVVSGNSVIGDVYGLYWIWDRIRVFHELPRIDTVRTPALQVRVGAAWGRSGFGGRSKADMRGALRQSLTWVAGPSVLDLVPWNSKPENTVNEKNREEARELIAYAHDLHMKYFSFSHGFTYHPSLLAETGATLSPCDPAFWDAVQEKYRRLFSALPELDGIEICNDDLTGYWDDYEVYDLLHENPECEWSFEKRFRTFVRAIHEVTVDQFDKTFFHFTWGLRSDEHHYQAAVFREIFDDTVPTRNLMLIPKITSADRWWHQPYNPTFNQTPHETIVAFEPMNYYEGSRTNVFPTFSGQYFQAGLQTFLAPENSNVRGASLLWGVGSDRWDTRSAYAYVLYRLTWDPYESIEQIAQDFCAIHFGRGVAEAMADIYLLTPAAYKYGLHIEPVSYGQYNSFIHMRVGTFPVEGYPAIDSGKEHIAFLRRIYLRCKPWKAETLDDLHHGLATAERMIELYKHARPQIADDVLARDLEERLDMTRLLIQTNCRYVETTFSYFEYIEQSDAERLAGLSGAYDALEAAREDFVSAPRFGYTLFGVDQLMANARAAVEDVKQAKQTLAEAPNRRQLEAMIRAEQALYKEALTTFEGELVKFAHFDMYVDGRDIVAITGDKYRIEHLRWDPPEVQKFEVLHPLPAEPVTVVPKDIRSRPIHPFVMEQPGAENDYTVRVFLNDLPGSKGRIICDLYYVAKPPDEIGLRTTMAIAK